MGCYNNLKVDKILNFINRTPIKSAGKSMEFLLYENDFAYFEKVKTKKIKVNDIVLVKKKQFFIHRVIYKNDGYIVTKGDNNLLSDGKIKPNQVLGKLIKIKRRKHFYKPGDIYFIQSGLYLKEIIRIRKLLKKNKIEYVFLKGLPLHLFFEGVHPKRLYFDCDILVDRQYFPKLNKIFLSQKYRTIDTSLSKQQSSIRTKLSECSYQKMVKGFPINFDVHLEAVFMMTQLGRLEALYSQRMIDQMTGEFIKNRRMITINKNYFPILSKNNLIVYLALHFFHHNFQGAFRLDFLDKVIRKSKLKNKDWAVIKSKIDQFSLENFVAPVFFLLKKYYKTPVPELINKKGVDVNIFDSEPRMVSGMQRFRNLFFLSPNPLWKKMLVFLNSEVIYALFFVLKEKLSYSLRAVLKNR